MDNAFPTFSLDRLEYFCYRRQYEEAACEILLLLRLLDNKYGDLSNNFDGRIVPGMKDEEVAPHYINRIAAALSAIFSDPQFTISTDGFRQFIFLHRWIGTLFCASTFGNADHVIRALNLKGPGAEEVEFGDSAQVQKFCLLFTPDSDIPLDLNVLWEYDRNLAATLCLALLSPRLFGSPAAHHKRELLLEWLPSRLGEVSDLSILPLSVLHDVYMHCSYADTPRRHAIKKGINDILLRLLAESGVSDIPASATLSRRHGKPIMLVVVEWFSKGHSIYRTHSRTLCFAREQFHVIGMGFRECVDEAVEEVFDEFISIDQGDSTITSLVEVRDKAAALAPAVFYMPSVGMFPLTMFLCNLRLAPIQVIALGHPATSYSPKIDWVSVEDDFVGDPACFTESLLRLPKDGQPYVPSINAVQLPERDYRVPAVVNIAVAATSMKINPAFLEVCKKICEHARVPVRLHFFVGFCRGLMVLQLRQIISRALPDAIVYPDQPYPQYLRMVNACDFFLSPFPFGNTNGIVDALSVGIPGVCLSGREVFEHIDEALYRRVGLPEWTIAHSHDEYLNAVLRMAENHHERMGLQQFLYQTRAVNKLFQGDARPFGQMLRQKVENLPAWQGQPLPAVFTGPLPGIERAASPASSTAAAAIAAAAIATATAAATAAKDLPGGEGEGSKPRRRRNAPKA